MGGLADERAMTIVVRMRSHGTFSVGPILARQIRRDDRVGDATVDVIGFTVMMVNLWMNMDQRYGQHPGRQPREDHQAWPQHIREHLWHESVHLDLAER